MHPLCPLSALEIEASVSLIKALHPPETDLLFKQITLNEPAKEQLAPYLDAEFSGSQKTSIDRRSFVNYYIRYTVRVLAIHALGAADLIYEAG